MAAYDIESFMVDLQTHLNANLNTKIGSINTEKSDSITLLTVDSSAYFLQTMDDTVSNYNPFIYYGIQDVESIGIGPATLATYTIVVALILSDDANDALMGRRLLRYQRALSEVIHDKYGSIGDSLKTKVRSLVPISFRFLDTTHDSRAIGVEIDVTLA